MLGGFCPGTSVVAAATLKIDGMLFLVGAFVGVWAFGESVGSFEPFWLSSSMGRLTLPEWLGLPMGVVVLLVATMAILAFWGAEQLEARFGAAPVVRREARWSAVAALLAGAVVLVVHGQPTPEQRWARGSVAAHKQVADRAIFASPAEVVSLRKDTSLEVTVLDVRNEQEYNLFHIGGARRIALAETREPALVGHLLDQPPAAVTFLVGNGEYAALRAWEALTAQGVSNLYVVEGGINHWLELYPAPACVAEPVPPATADELAFRFSYASGQSLPAAWPELATSTAFRSPCGDAQGEGHHAAVAGHAGIVWPAHPFTKRVKLLVKVAVKGGCG